jgi:hypothetical protein
MIRGKKRRSCSGCFAITNKRATENLRMSAFRAIAMRLLKRTGQHCDRPADLWVKTCFVDQGPSKQRAAFVQLRKVVLIVKSVLLSITIELRAKKPRAKLKKTKDQCSNKRAAPPQSENAKAEPAKTPKRVATTVSPKMLRKSRTAAPAVTPAADSVEEIAGATTPIDDDDKC